MSQLAIQPNLNGGWIEYGIVTVDPASLTTLAAGNTDVTISGVKTGDHVIGMVPPATLETGLQFVGANVQAANTVRIKIFNASAGTIDGAALVWKYVILHLS